VSSSSPSATIGPTHGDDLAGVNLHPYCSKVVAGSLGRRNAGTSERWNVGTLERRNAGTLVGTMVGMAAGMTVGTPVGMHLWCFDRTSSHGHDRTDFRIDRTLINPCGDEPIKLLSGYAESA
jgi:hypothetical protein